MVMHAAHSMPLYLEDGVPPPALGCISVCGTQLPDVIRPSIRSSPVMAQSLQQGTLRVH